MSNTETIRVITIGMKYSGKEFVVKESMIEPKQFEQFIDNLNDGMTDKIERVRITTTDNDFLYVSIEAIAYITISDEPK